MKKNKFSLRLVEAFQCNKEIKKSVFQANAIPINSIDEGKLWLNKQRSIEATHHCWAMRVAPYAKYDDDGEPVGKAGRPILHVIEKLNFDCILLIVSRWFGGIKLGAGGLVRAYSVVTAECLRQAKSIEYKPQVKIRLLCSFKDHLLIRTRIVEYDAQLISERFDQDVEIIFFVPLDVSQALCARLKDLTRGQILIDFPNELDIGTSNC